MAYGAGQWTARQAEAGFFGPSDHLEASADGNWGLGFPEKGKTPVGNASAEYLKQYHYILLILDINLPDGNGFELYSELKEKSNASIIFLTANDLENDIVKGFDLGADDYITKPFRPLVLGAKVKALIRRTKNMGNHSDTIQCGPFTYESSTMRFYKDGEELILSSKESALLLLFIKHPGQVYTKDMIYEQVWGTTIAIDDNAIMVYINRLRSKIEKDRQKPEHIITVRGMGYRFLP